MKKFFYSLLIITVLSFIFIPTAQATITYNRTAGPYVLYNGDTLKTSTTLTYPSMFIISGFQYCHLWVYTANAADSVSYRVWYRFALSPTDTFCALNDTSGTALSTTIMRVSDRGWHYIAFDLPDAIPPYMQFLVTSGAGNGTRTKIYIKTYFSP
jgi:hypothetical protein